MSTILVTISLLSGRGICLEVGLESTVSELKTRAGRELGIGLRALIGASGELPAALSLKALGIQNGEALTACARRLQLASAGGRAFAFLRANGSVFTWGDVQCGGDSSHIKHQLQDVVQIQATLCAFAALREDGSVVTWGHRNYGGDSDRVRSRLQDVCQIVPSMSAFAALLGSGSVVCWGDVEVVRSSKLAEDELVGVHQILATLYAFAAVRNCGSVVTWVMQIVVVTASMCETGWRV